MPVSTMSTDAASNARSSAEKDARRPARVFLRAVSFARTEQGWLRCGRVQTLIECDSPADVARNFNFAFDIYTGEITEQLAGGLAEKYDLRGYRVASIDPEPYIKPGVFFSDEASRLLARLLEAGAGSLCGPETGERCLPGVKNMQDEVRFADLINAAAFAAAFGAREPAVLSDVARYDL